MVLYVMLLIFSESSRWVGVHRLGLRLFGVTVWKLLIIEPFSQWKLSKIKTENCIGIWGRSWCCWKALGKSNLIEFISQFLKLMCERYWFLQKLQKLGLEGKISLALNVFTLGPRPQATLVMDEMKMRMSKTWRRSVWTGCKFWNEANGSQCRIHGSINANGSKC
jgi:hypothetical protein